MTSLAYEIPNVAGFRLILKRASQYYGIYVVPLTI